MTVAKTTKTRAKKALAIPMQMTTRKKKASDVKEDWPLTDFNESPVPGNTHGVEIGDFVTLTRSMLMLNGNILWMRGVEVRIQKLTKLDSGLIVADTTRPDGTEVQFCACWLKPVLIEEPLIVQQEEAELEPMLD